MILLLLHIDYIQFEPYMSIVLEDFNDVAMFWTMFFKHF